MLLLALPLLAVWYASNRTSAPAASGRAIRDEVSVPPADHATIRIAQFNIHGGRDEQKQHVLEQIAPQLGDYHIIGLNEVKGASLWGGPDQAEVIGSQLGVGHLFAPAERRWFQDHYGNALLTKLPVEHWQKIPLPCTNGKGYRNLLLASLPLGDDDVTVLITHLDRKKDREAHLDMVLNLFMLLEPPVVLLGDMNTTGLDERIQKLLASGEVVDAIDRFAGPAPPAKFNWILCRGLDVRAAGKEDLGLSDHPLYWAEVSLLKKAATSPIATEPVTQPVSAQHVPEDNKREVTLAVDGLSHE